ncbi:MAG: DNA topoisomerase I [Candidatus Micrarchaeota archaeon]|nr:DNA topoisomerase I [Candidatus Micrarchaeota archaeon]
MSKGSSEKKELVICEKPNVAKKIADALSKLGDITTHKYKIVTYYEIKVKNENKIIYVAPAAGHLFTLKTDSKNLQYPVFEVYWDKAYEKGRTNLNYLKSYIQLFEDLGRKIDTCISACDYDIEGSLIGYNVIRFCCKKNDGKRMKFSTLTEEELLQSYLEKNDLDYNNAIAGETRHILDWFYGINLSRALMSALKTAKNWHKIFSIGRVQGPTLHLIVELEKEILNFVPQPYYVITAIIKNTLFNYEQEKINDKNLAKEILEKIKKEKYALIKKIEKSKVYQNPYPPFDLTSLQTEAYRIYGFKPAYTLEVAQSLYEKSYISYPRTSSQKLPEKLNLKGIILKLKKINEYSDLVEKLDTTKKLKPFEGQKTDQAHPAIHPTGYYGNMTDNEKKVYDLIVKRFLACFHKPCIREKTVVLANIADLNFIAKGMITVDKGWAEIYNFVRMDEEEIEQFEENKNYEIKKPEMQEKFTKPPSRYTQASLISQMEKLNLGTKATRANIIETLYERGYIEGKNIKPTKIGIMVHNTLMKFSSLILDVELTRDFENKMDAIIENNADHKSIIEEGKKILSKILAEFKKHEIEIGNELAKALTETEAENNLLGKCSSCNNGDLFIRYSIKLKRRFVGCSNYPACKATYSLPLNGKIEKTEKVCEYCKTPIIRVIRKGKKSYEMCLSINCKSKEDWLSNNKHKYLKTKDSHKNKEDN